MNRSDGAEESHKSVGGFAWFVLSLTLSFERPLRRRRRLCNGLCGNRSSRTGEAVTHREQCINVSAQRQASEKEERVISAHSLSLTYLLSPLGRAKLNVGRAKSGPKRDRERACESIWTATQAISVRARNKCEAPPLSLLSFIDVFESDTTERKKFIIRFGTRSLMRQALMSCCAQTRCRCDRDRRRRRRKARVRALLLCPRKRIALVVVVVYFCRSFTCSMFGK